MRTKELIASFFVSHAEYLRFDKAIIEVGIQKAAQHFIQELIKSNLFRHETVDDPTLMGSRHVLTLHVIMPDEVTFGVKREGQPP